ncbi:hypothetical protein T4B_12733 [Trichinella pseudospiralis]|uniref:Uncharacterized protein n=2 Tax=Trichinella pseudospiralis TaxID=6337 RepID=A0A0V1G403_TRIPS|nr:hypothetical protein T4E_6036 [Trichinella pseudospiralis]KRY65741.1 hypothetical protein T4A_5302 [Trichinella pseudospiralis]KRY93008.1 hypothetical protein T4D_4755 [Trichinella pseudospiralis]KRZ11117.1 hypothetical protein T4B_12733 [Trichinella pseudospiralis]KRZ46344.1 hypothetical protein T4C_3324 [Trichinella pseudospiralis]
MFDRVGEEQADVHAAEDAEDEEKRGQHGRNARLGRLHRTWYAHHQQAGKVSGCERQQRVHDHVEPVVAHQYCQGPLLGQQVAEHEKRYEEHARRDHQREPTVTQRELHPSAGEVSEQGEQVERQKAAHGREIAWFQRQEVGRDWLYATAQSREHGQRDQKQKVDVEQLQPDLLKHVVVLLALGTQGGANGRWTRGQQATIVDRGGVGKCGVHAEEVVPTEG